MGEGHDGRARALGYLLDPLSSHRGGDRAARLPPIPATFVEETMNREIGTESADFTYIYKKGSSF